MRPTIKQRMEGRERFLEILDTIPPSQLVDALMADDAHGLGLVGSSKNPQLLGKIFDALKAIQPTKKAMERLPVLGGVVKSFAESHLHKLLFASTRTRGFILLLEVEKSGNVECLQMVLRELQKMNELKSVMERLDYYPLKKAARLGSVEIVRMLMGDLSKREQMRLMQDMNYSLFKEAADAGKDEMVEELTSIALRLGGEGLTQEMLLSDSCSAFRTAATKGNFDMTVHLMELASPSTLKTMLDSFNHDALRQAILKSRNPALVDVLIKSMKKTGLWEAVNLEGLHELICVAAQSGYPAVFDRILAEIPTQRREDIIKFQFQSHYYRKNNLLCGAARSNNAEIINNILAMCSPETRQRILMEEYDTDGFMSGPKLPSRPLKEAVEKGALEAARALIALLKPEERSAVIIAGNNHLLKSAANKEDAKMVHELLNGLSNPEERRAAILAQDNFLLKTAVAKRDANTLCELLNGLTPEQVATILAQDNCRMFHAIKGLGNHGLLARVLEITEGQPQNAALLRVITPAAGSQVLMDRKLNSWLNAESLFRREALPNFADTAIGFAEEMMRQIYVDGINNLFGAREMPQELNELTEAQKLEWKFSQLDDMQRVLLRSAGRRFAGYLYDNLGQFREMRDALINKLPAIGMTFADRSHEGESSSDERDEFEDAMTRLASIRDPLRERLQTHFLPTDLRVIEITDFEQFANKENFHVCCKVINGTMRKALHSVIERLYNALEKVRTPEVQNVPQAEAVIDRQRAGVEEVGGAMVAQPSSMQLAGDATKDQSRA